MEKILDNAFFLLEGVAEREGPFYETGVHFPLFNGFCQKSAEVPSIAEVKERFAEKKLPWTWWVHPSHVREGFEAELEAAGLVNPGEFTAVSCKLPTKAVPLAFQEGVSLREIDFPVDYESFVHVFGEAFSFPKEIRKGCGQIFKQVRAGELIHYLGFVDGAPSGSLTLFIHDGVAGLYNLGVLPQARGRGLATALCEQALRDAAAKSASLAVAQLDSNGLAAPIFSKLGFTSSGTFKPYMSL